MRRLGREGSEGPGAFGGEVCGGQRVLGRMSVGA